MEDEDLEPVTSEGIEKDIGKLGGVTNFFSRGALGFEKVIESWLLQMDVKLGLPLGPQLLPTFVSIQEAIGVRLTYRVDNWLLRFSGCNWDLDKLL